MRQFVALIFLFISGAAYSFDRNDLAVQINQLEKYNITAKLSKYVIGNSPVDVSLAFLYFNADKFRPVHETNNGFINDGLISSEKWFALPLQNNTSKDVTVVLEFIASDINTIECYEVNDVSQINHIPSSQNAADQFSQRVLSTPVIFNVLVPENGKNLLLLHTFNKGQMLHLPSSIYTIHSFRKYEGYKNNFFGIFQGIFLFIILFNLLIYVSTWDRIYLLYMIYAFFIGVFALNDAGAVPVNFPFSFSGQMFLFCGFSAWLLLMRSFLNLSKSNFSLYSFLGFLAIVDLAIALVPYLLKMFSNEENKILQSVYQSGLNILFAANLLFIIITNISRLSYKNKLAIFYGIANIPVIAGTLIYYTNYYGFTNIQFGWLNPIALGLSIETFALSFGFAYRYNLIGKEKRQLLLQLNKQQQEITQQIINTQEAERKRIALDLHDELGGNLAAIKMALQNLDLPATHSKKMNQLIDNATNNTRNITHNLMPPEFEQAKLDNLLDNYYQQLSNDNTCTFRFYSSGSNNHFNKQGELIIYRIFMELSNNICNHAYATEATLQLIYYDNYLEVMAEDNGTGFSEKQHDGMGLKNITSRVNYLKGKLNIDSGKLGTTIVIQIPYA